MATFLLRDVHAALDRARERRLARMPSEVAVKGEKPQPKSKLPADPITLRGVPFIGRGIGGTMLGSAPEPESVQTVSRLEALRERMETRDDGDPERNAIRRLSRLEIVRERMRELAENLPGEETDR